MDSVRKKISRAAQDLYLREGLEGFSMRKVAELVGVSAPAIYRHFRNKDDLLNEIVIEGLRILEQYLRPALDAATPYDRLTRLTENYLKFALEQPQYFDFAFLIPSRAIDRFAEEIARPEWATFRLAVEQVGSCVKQGIFVEADPLETAITIWAEIHGLVTLFRTGRFGPDEQLFRQIYLRSVDRVVTGMMSEQGRAHLAHDA